MKRFVERGDGEDGEPAALRGVGHDLAEASLEHLADPSVELAEARAHLRPLLDALEDEPEHEPAQLGSQAQGFAEELPGGVRALVQRGERQHGLGRPLRQVQFKVFLGQQGPRGGSRHHSRVCAFS
jgi:hypothetical protein